MANIDYIKLYELQDQVMNLFFSNQDIFYLTGRTCLSRFYQEKRYSDDLDFFTHENDEFSKVLRKIRVMLKQNFEIVESVTSKDFVRLKIDKVLQVDFVNDRVMRYKDIIYLENGYMIDNYENILANKITAVIGRDNPKDIFDIYLIDKFYTISWDKILNAAHQKSVFSNDDLIIRLKTFPVQLLKHITLVDNQFLNGFEKEYSKIIEKIEKTVN